MPAMIIGPTRPGKPLSRRALRYRDLAIFAVLALSFFLIHDFIAPLLVGFLFAVVLYPIYKWFLPRKLPPAGRAAVITIVFALVFLLPIGGLIFAGTDLALDAISGFREKYLEEGSQGDVSELIEQYLSSGPMQTVGEWLPLDRESIRDALGRVVGSVGPQLANLLKEVLAALPKTLFSIFLILLATYYGLTDGPRLVAYLKQQSPFLHTNTELLFSRVESACQSAIVASAMTGLVQAVILVVASLITSLPHVWMVGLGTFLFSFLPMIGTTPATVVGFGYLLIQGETGNAILFLIFGLLAGLSDNVTRPFFLKGKTAIHPLAGLVFTFGAVAVLGFSGLFLGPVVAGLFFAVGDLRPMDGVETEAVKDAPPLEPAHANT